MMETEALRGDSGPAAPFDLQVRTDNGTFVVQVSATNRISEVKVRISALKNIPTEKQVLSKEGGEPLDDTAIVGSLGLQRGSTLVLKTKSAGEDEDQLPPEELPRALVVTNIPLRPRDQTEEEIVQVFYKFGEITRLILKSDSQSSQHAVLIFSAEDAVKRAAEQSSLLLFGKRVNVIPASRLSKAPGSSGVLNEASSALGSLFAGGYLMTKQAFSTISKLADEAKVPETVKGGAEKARSTALALDEKTKLTEKVSGLAAAAKGTAAQLDSRLHLSSTASSVGQAAAVQANAAAKTAANTAQQISSKAMQNEYVSTGVKSIGSIFQTVAAFSAKTVEQTKKKIAEGESPSSLPAAPSSAPAATFAAPQPPPPLAPSAETGGQTKMGSKAMDI